MLLSRRGLTQEILHDRQARTARWGFGERLPPRSPLCGQQQQLHAHAQVQQARLCQLPLLPWVAAQTYVRFRQDMWP